MRVAGAEGLREGGRGGGVLIWVAAAGAFLLVAGAAERASLRGAALAFLAWGALGFIAWLVPAPGALWGGLACLAGVMLISRTKEPL